MVKRANAGDLVKVKFNADKEIRGKKGEIVNKIKGTNRWKVLVKQSFWGLRRNQFRIIKG